MIRFVTKSNGKKEEFNPEKLRKWSEFAAGKLNWSEIELDAVKRCYEGIPTRELHKAMIAACIDKKTQAYSDMAGRLLLGMIYKQAHGGYGSIPSLLEFYNQSVASGNWCRMDYTEEEIKEIGKVVKHDKNLNYGYSVLRQMVDKYLVKDAVNDIVHESPQFLFIGIAMKVMEIQPKDRRVEDVKKLYTYISDLKINLPSPYLTTLRTNIPGAASCCLFRGDDTAESLKIANMLAHEYTLNNAGIGVNLQTRATGQGIKNNRIIHGGLIPYLKWMEDAVGAAKQATRGGSATITYTILEPDFDDLIRLKNPTTPVDKRVDKLDYSVVVNRSFLRRAAKGEDWMLVSCDDAPELYEALYKTEEEFDEVYEKVSRKRIKKKFVKARDLLAEIITQRAETGRIYMFFADNVNNHTPFKDTIYQSNLCVAPETQILTSDGYKVISELENQPVEIWNGQEWSQTVVRRTGKNQKLITVVTDSGQELVCTPYHKFYVQEGYARGTGFNKKVIKEVRAADLKSGDKLIKFDLPVIKGKEHLTFAYENGFYSGDGCEVHKGNNQRIYLYGNKMALLDNFEGYTYLTTTEKRHTLTYKGELKDKFYVPNSVIRLEDRLEWLAGYLDADGCVYRNNGNQQLAATSTNKNFLLQVQRMLQEMGVNSKIAPFCKEGMKTLPKNDGTGEKGDYFCCEAWRITIPSIQTQALLALGLNLHRLHLVQHEPNRDAQHFIKIVEIKDEGRYDDTFCFTEEKRHMGMFNGLLTGQCQEIFLPTKAFHSTMDLYTGDNLDDQELALCFLSSIVAGRVKPEEYEDVAYYTVLTIDNVIETMEYPFKHNELTAKARRSIGVGITNLAHYLASNFANYSDPYGKKLIHELAERHYYWLARASLRLGKEKGNAEWMHKTKWPEGWLPIDTYSKAVDSIGDFPLQFDWEELRKDIIDNGGIRNSVLMAIAPNESSSLVSNTTNSVYPVRDTMTYKQSQKGNVLFIVPDYEKLKTVYQSAWDTPPKDMAEAYGILTKFADQGMSCDEFLDYSKMEGGRISIKEQMKFVLLFAKYGGKSLYYMNSKTKSAESLAQEDLADGCAACRM